ncbi:MAG: hypothetical protein D3909_00045 [Candidatus Electrothrix sp. ATG1]|nr:hypothetical protein [Candidatus Electrothrix sp. ATG1]MCI5207201.1 hypothetical protein [Candidatus Electrothrix sp. ATG2]
MEQAVLSYDFDLSIFIFFWKYNSCDGTEKLRSTPQTNFTIQTSYSSQTYFLRWAAVDKSNEKRTMRGFLRMLFFVYL